jgi:hypothetical protein
MNVQNLLRGTTLLAGIRAEQKQPSSPSQTPVSGHSVAFDESGAKARLLTVAGAAQVKMALKGFSLLLPVELKFVNQSSSTNARHCKIGPCTNPTMCQITTYLT